MNATRRLAAILAADVAGYSRLMGADEAGTLRRLKALRDEVIDPTITEHRGRIVKTTGDGLIVEFTSVVDALRCAAAWQAAMADHNAESGDSCIEFRIGVHQGDIVVSSCFEEISDLGHPTVLSHPAVCTLDASWHSTVPRRRKPPFQTGPAERGLSGRQTARVASR